MTSVQPTFQTIDLDNIQFQDPERKDDICVGAVTDRDGGDINFTITKPLNELVHVAGNRAYVDIKLGEDCIRELEHLDQHIIDTVHTRSPDWFGETIPKEVVCQFFRSCISKRKGVDAPYLRAKVLFQKQTPCINIHEERIGDEFESDNEDEDDEGTLIHKHVVETLEPYQGCNAQFIVNLRSIRFLKQSFTPELLLSHVRLPCEAERRGDRTRMNFAQMIIETHEMAERRRQYEDKHNELLNLEKLKQEVESEIEALSTRQQSITQNYDTVLKEEQKLLKLAGIVENSDENVDAVSAGDGNDNTATIAADVAADDTVADDGTVETNPDSTETSEQTDTHVVGNSDTEAVAST